MATTYLESDFTGTGASGPAIATYSMWVKLELSDTRATLVSGKDNGSYLKVRFADDGSGHYLGMYGSSMDMKSTRLFRDPAAWYHVVMAFDTGQAAADDRIKVWINNEQITDWPTNTRLAQNDPLYLTKADNVQIGAYNNTEHFDGVMAHVHCCDGTAYTPADFGETDSTSGIWIAKTSPSVTYGSKGYFLKFASGAHGTDSSGNGNDFTVNGTMTNTKDTPDNNFCTMNPLDNYLQSMTFSNGNNTIVTDYASPATATIGVTTGKWYWECKAVASSGGDFYTGVRSTQVTDANAENGYRANDWSYYGPTGNYLNNNTDTSYGTSYTVGDIIGVALDVTNSKLYFSKNGVWQDSGDPTSGATGTGAISITAVASTPLGLYIPAAGGWSSSVDYTWSMNFGNGFFGTTTAGTETDDAGIGLFKYDVPAGYYALCTNNLGDQS